MENHEFSQFVNELSIGGGGGGGGGGLVLATLSVLVVRIVPLEYSNLHEKAYKCIVCEFGCFVHLNVLCDACIYPYIESTDFLILTQSIGRCMLYKGIAQKCFLSQI